MTESGSESESELGIFQEPDDFYKPEKPATFVTYQAQSCEISLRLVGHNPLWGHLLWNAGQVIARYLEDNDHYARGKTVLELGAGAGLPGLLSAKLGASKVLITDYPDMALIENLDYNIQHALTAEEQTRCTAQGYLWGSGVSALLSGLPTPNEHRFDLLILADILFNHSEHHKLIDSIQATMRFDGCALVFFTPYRPHLFDKDMHFFELAKNIGLRVTKLFEHTMDKVMFPDDPGDENLRRTVFAYELRWPA